MKQLLLSLGTLFLVASLSSCSQKLVPFTQQMRESYKLSVEDLQSIQFYNSNSIVLKRGEETGMKETENGELTLKKEHYIEEIVIKEKTPCIVRSSIDGNTITVEFEDGTNRYLVFGSRKNRDGYYTLQALEWNNGKGKVNYGDKYYYAGQGSKDVFLALKLKSIENFKSEQKVVKGKKL